MSEIPEDLDPIIIEIDAKLKEKGVKPQGRPMAAIVEFGKQFHLSMPFTAPHPGVPLDVAQNWKYAHAIYRWYEESLGDRLKIDPSDKAKVVAEVDGDLWEIRLPILYGSATLHVPRTTQTIPHDPRKGPVPINVCAQITGITDARLKSLSDDDLLAFGRRFALGLDVRHGFDPLRKVNNYFEEAVGDLSVAVMHLTAQQENFGQSRWASEQFVEKAMKGVLAGLGETIPKRGHNLEMLHRKVAAQLDGFDASAHLPDLKCTAAVRYGEVESTRAQAYAAHSASLELVHKLAEHPKVQQLWKDLPTY